MRSCEFGTGTLVWVLSHRATVDVMGLVQDGEVGGEAAPRISFLGVQAVPFVNSLKDRLLTSRLLGHGVTTRRRARDN